MSYDSCFCLIGALLIKLGQGLLITWGKTNIYYYSYYKHHNPDLQISYNTMPLAFMALPIALITVFSVKLAKKIGFELLIRISCFIQMISLLIAPYMEDYLSFIIFYFVIFGFGYAFQAFPILTIVWSHFQKTEGKVTGLLFGAFGISTFCFVILITYIVNPNNEKATLIIENGHQTYHYFSYDVAENAKEAAYYAGLVAGICSAVGSLLIRKKKEKNNYKAVDIEMKDNSSKKEEEIKPLDEEDKQQINGDIVVDDDLTELKVTNSFQQALKSQQFIIIICCQCVLAVFVLSLGMNYKAYAISKINNDYFITLVDMIALLASAIANMIWGVLIDKVSFKYLFGSVYLISGLGAILLPLTMKSNIYFLINYVIMMVFDKGAIVIIGPGLLKIFGADLGHQLFPMTYLGSMLAFILSPLSQFILLKYIDLDFLFQIYGGFIILAILLIIQLKMNYVS